MNLSMLLEMVADVHGDRVAVTCGDEQLDYRQLLDRARAAAGLLGERSQALAAIDETSPDTPVLLFAAALAGVPFAPLNYRLSDEQLAEELRELAPVTCVVGPEQNGRVQAGGGIVVVDRAELPVEAAPRPATDARDAVWLFTSGTSGTPKVVVLRHEHLVSYVLSSIEFAAAEPDEAILVSVPPYHIAGIASVLTSVYAGRRMVQLPRFTPEAWVETVAAEQVTQAMVVPTMLGRILDLLEARGEPLPALRHLSYGGGRMPLPVVERALRVLPHVDLVNAYGLTETASTISVLGPEDHRAAARSDDPDARRRLGSVGRPVPSVELEIRDPDGRVLPAGEPGEIHVRGPQVSGEYRSHRATDEAGWFPTRDRGWLDAAGYLYLDGRADDVIVRGGENLSPGEIEDILLSHPGVADVAVVGVPDLDWGERVEAVVVPTSVTTPPDPGELQDLVRTRLRSSKTPATIHLRGELPRNDLGKLLRFAVRDDLVAATVDGASTNGNPT
ncbi:acyl--CoA ligase [Nitriliruptoraceae bacterium ZYF776]|nr:acyl--CoA ligase [Profundirhabdus halotolerans]